MEKKICRRCLLEDMNDKDAERVVKDYLETMNSSEKIDDQSYRNRLDICKTCDKLLNGTCLECGCYVEIRAVLINATCPSMDKKW